MDGVFIIDKPAGMTSHDVVARVRKIIGARRVGHTGTLDPFATGVLVTLVGRATRLAQFLSGADKEYEAVIRLGYATNTGDVTGSPQAAEPLANVRQAQSLSKEEIEAAMLSLKRLTEQIPPMYSAKKVDGRKLYDLARRGEHIDRKAVRIQVSEFEPILKDGSFLKVGDEQTADLHVRVACSAGTYIRALAEDLGKRLRVGAHLVELRRTRAGQFKIQDAFSLERLAELSSANSLESMLISPDAALAHLPAIQIDDEGVRRILNGIDIPFENSAGLPQTGTVRLRDANGKLLAVGVYNETRQLIHPKVVLANVSEARP